MLSKEPLDGLVPSCQHVQQVHGEQPITVLTLLEWTCRQGTFPDARLHRSTVPWDPSGATLCLRAARSATGRERRRQANQPETNGERQIPGIKSLDTPSVDQDPGEHYGSNGQAKEGESNYRYESSAISR